MRAANRYLGMKSALAERKRQLSPGSSPVLDGAGGFEVQGNLTITLFVAHAGKSVTKAFPCVPRIRLTPALLEGPGRRQLRC